MAGVLRFLRSYQNRKETEPKDTLLLLVSKTSKFISFELRHVSTKKFEKKKHCNKKKCVILFLCNAAGVGHTINFCR